MLKMKPYITVLVNKMIMVICCIHCGFTLPGCKIILHFLPVVWCKKVENHCSVQTNPVDRIANLLSFFMC